MTTKNQTLRSGYNPYPLNQSPLYRLRTKKKLAELLQIELGDLRRLLARNGNYRIAAIPKPDGSARQIEDPKDTLKGIHRRFFKLLCRIEAPVYLHSGVKHRSYLSNAKKHVGQGGLVKTDIKKFFPSTTFQHIRRGISKIFKCSPDVAYLIAKLCTVDNHLPTGSPISGAVAYYAHKDMFDRLFRIAEERGWTLTCYVDDISISGEGVNRQSLALIRRVVADAGLSCNTTKERVYGRDEPKIVTGTVVDANGIRLPNKRQKAIYEGLSRLCIESDPEVKTALIKQLTGRVNEAAHVDPTFQAKLRWFEQVLTKHSSDAAASTGEPSRDNLPELPANARPSPSTAD